MTDPEITAAGPEGGSVRYKIEGLGQTLRQLSKAGAEAEELRELMIQIGQLVARDARARAPVDTGRLSSTVRHGRGKTKAVIRAGGARAPYAGVIHYGWPARNIKPSEFLTRAVQANREAVLDMFDKDITRLLKKYNLM